MINNAKGHKKTGGRKKGSKNKASLLMVFSGITENDKEIIFKKAMELVKKGNVTIITKLLDKMISNAEPKQLETDIDIPRSIDELTDKQVGELYEKLRNRK